MIEFNSIPSRKKARKAIAKDVEVRMPCTIHYDESNPILTTKTEMRIANRMMDIIQLASSEASKIEKHEVAKLNGLATEAFNRVNNLKDGEIFQIDMDILCREYGNENVREFALILGGMLQGIRNLQAWSTGSIVKYRIRHNDSSNEVINEREEPEYIPPKKKEKYLVFNVRQKGTGQIVHTAMHKIVSEDIRKTKEEMMLKSKRIKEYMNDSEVWFSFTMEWR